jgi:hypothetical protein
MKILIAVSSLIYIATLSLPAMAGSEKFDKGMNGLVEQYFIIHTALAGDKTTGVAKAAKAITRLSKKLKAKSVEGEHAKHYLTLPSKLKAAATKLSKAKKIEAAREAFKELSRPMAMWVSMSKPAGLSVIFCSMARGSWIQKDTRIRNPYYGAKMLKCGEVVGGANKGHAGGHMKKGGHSHHGEGGHAH